MHFVYFRGSPTLSLQRIKERNREGEQDISLAYLTDLYREHENWIHNLSKVENVTILNANANMKDKVVFQEYLDFILQQ